jgi:Secretion system C-terminal sorting domain
MKFLILNYKLINKFILVVIINIVCAAPSAAQTINLIPDPSFEDTLSLSNVEAQLSLKYWKNLDSNKLHTCQGAYLSVFAPIYTLPLNQACYQYPRSGNGILALTGFVYNNIFRSITRTKLKSKLIAGKTYCVKINAVFADNPAYWVTDALQLYFDNGGLDTMISIHNDSIGIYPFITPQVSNPVGHILTDTMNWNLIVGSFVANGTEEFLTIGNFKADSNVQKIALDPNNPNPCFCYDLLIDDVSVYPIDLANWLPPTYGYPIGDTAIIGLPNYETPDAKWYTYNMVLIDSGSQIKVVPPSNGTKYICGIDMCNTMVFDTVEVRWFPLSSGEWQMVSGELSVYPNPASDVIQVSNIMGDKVSLYNTVGQLVAEQKVVQNKAELQVAHLPKGLYVVKTAGQVAKVVIR